MDFPGAPGAPGMRAELNPPQAEAVATLRGPLLLFAGAGSGKTRVITYRIANLVARERVAPWKILAVTFTNKAAAEMRARLESPEMLGAIARDLWVGTFHAVCVKFLRMFPEAIGRTRNFVIYDSTDQKTLVARALRELQLDEKRYPPKQVLSRLHKEKQEGRSPEEMPLDNFFDDVIQKAYVRYEHALRSANALDFEDLILGVVRILESTDPDPKSDVTRAKAALERKFEYVLVDEFQDTNQVQYRLLRGLAAWTRNLCVVGDDDQSIYRWRGADVRNIRGFRNDYPDARVIKLEQNYRSSKRIVAAALAVIAPSPTREPKELWTANDDGLPIRVVACSDERDEAACVVRALRDAKEAGIEASGIAVFYRVHAQARVLEEALRAVRIPYQIVGGAKFYERAEIKDAIAYLRVLINPQSDVDLLRVINNPPRGIGSATVERLAARARVEDISLFQALERLDLFGDELGAAPKKRVGQFRELMKSVASETEGKAPAEALRIVMAKTGYRRALEQDDAPEAEGRLENLGELEGSMHDYTVEAEAQGEVPTLAGFLERVTLQSDQDGTDPQDRVTLMTVHGAKGLEFDVVVLTGMEEGIFPYKSLEGRSVEEMEEERRLAYVAITRAREHLLITHAGQRQIFGKTRLGTPSRFLSDLPPDAVEAIQTEATRRAVRFVDDPAGGLVASNRGPWRHPQSVRGPAGSVGREPGDRYVEYEHGDMESGDSELRRGMTVSHEKFGRGQVLSVTMGGEPAVVVLFPGWGEKKVLARFLRLS